MTRPRCQGKRKDGEQCPYRVPKGQKYCGKHLKQGKAG